LLPIICATSISARADPGNRDALRQIVQDHCVVHWREAHDPAPCERLVPPSAAGTASGYAVLKDRKGGAHYLLIPARTVGGLESPELLEPGAPNYLAAAWRARDLLAGAAGFPVPRAAAGLAINSIHYRSQDQFHIHIECLQPAIADAVRRLTSLPALRWSPVSIQGAPYQAMRIPGTNLGDVNPIQMLAQWVARRHDSMADYSLVLAAADSPDGAGFIALASNAAAGERMLDSTCAAARLNRDP
jgi:CDP-diacylglycerol pyrophosphatase